MTAATAPTVCAIVVTYNRRDMLRRCLADDESGRTLGDLDPTTLERIEQAMAEASPILDHPLAIACHACAAEQTVRFDIQTFLLRALEHERRYLIREIHYLARGYGWSYGFFCCIRSNRSGDSSNGRSMGDLQCQQR